MAATILLRTLGGIDDRRVVLSSGSIARPLGFGTDWTKIRIGVRWSMTNTAANLTGTPRFAIGACSGTTNIFGDATVTNFVGVISNQATWTFSAGTPPMYRYTSGSLFYACKKVGSTLTVGAGTGDYVNFYCDPSLAYRSMHFVEIWKGSPNFTLRSFVNQNTNVDASLDTFLNLMEGASPTQTGYAWGSSGGNTTFAADEVAGALDTVNLYWERSNPVFEISDLAIARLA